jgi:hypothetical protein
LTTLIIFSILKNREFFVLLKNITNFAGFFGKIRQIFNITNPDRYAATGEFLGYCRFSWRQGKARSIPTMEGGTSWKQRY